MEMKGGYSGQRDGERSDATIFIYEDDENTK